VRGVDLFGRDVDEQRKKLQRPGRVRTVGVKKLRQLPVREWHV
jgi:hypothetical protein